MSTASVKKLLQEKFKNEHLLKQFEIITEAVEGWNGKDSQPLDSNSLAAFRTFLCQFDFVNPTDIENTSLFLSIDGLISLELRNDTLECEIVFNKDSSAECRISQDWVNHSVRPATSGVCLKTPFKELLLSEQLRLSLL